jgi:site-specific recombinase XerD
MYSHDNLLCKSTMPRDSQKCVDRKRWGLSCAYVGLKDASSHSERRTYITRLANKGVGVRLLAELAGHSHISTTQRYIDVNAEQLSEAVELL